MPKKAVLVTLETMVRVVVDLPEGVEPDSDEAFDVVSKAAIENIRSAVYETPDYPYPENITEITEDLEIPYGEAPEDQ